MSIDFNINNYTNDELYQLIDLTGDVTKKQITDTTNGYIQKYVKENKSVSVFSASCYIKNVWGACTIKRHKSY